VSLTPAVFDGLDLRDPAAVADILHRGAAANLTSPVRRGCIELVTLAPTDRLILTGDLHDNPLHLARLIRAAGMDGHPSGSVHPPSEIRHPISHLTLHELIHGDRLTNGMDFSFRVLARAAALKAAFPLHVHTLLANHELSQIVGAGIVKDGVRVVEAFNDAVDYTFADGGAAPSVHAAIAAFIRSMPLAVRFTMPTAPALGDVLCAHSLPPPELMDRFDPAILEREQIELTDDDLIPRRGSAHLMVWGRGHTPEQLTSLAQRWNVALFVLGHEKAESGLFTLDPNTLILNSDHDRGVYLDAPADTARIPTTFAATAVRLADP
jgi:hypothetical protein